jgi:hypothetical protein
MQLLPQRLVALALGLFLTACATSSDYKPLMTSFSTATATAQQALEAYDKAAAQRFIQLRRQAAIARPVGVQPPVGDCATGATRCRILLFAMPGDPAPAALSGDSLAPNQVAAMRAVAAYAKALQDLADADATPAIKTASEKAGAAISALANIAAPGGGAAVTPFAVPLANAVAWFYGKYQERMKLAALQHATAEMAPILASAVSRFATTAQFVSKAELARLVDTLDMRQAAFDMAPSEATLEALLASADNLDQALVTKPQDVFNNLAAAHDELARALNNPDASWQTAFERIDRLNSDAEALGMIASGFLAAANMR